MIRAAALLLAIIMAHTICHVCGNVVPHEQDPHQPGADRPADPTWRGGPHASTLHMHDERWPPNHYLDPRSGDPYPPVNMLLRNGCSMSGAVYFWTAALLDAHGFRLSDLGDYGWEWNRRVNKMSRSSGLSPSHLIAEQIRASHANNELLFYKIHVHEMLGRHRAALLEAGTRVVYVPRFNALDRMICMIRDCFSELEEYHADTGISVFANGTQSKLCFQRRFSSEVVMAKIAPRGLVSNLREMMALEAEAGRMVSNAGFQHGDVKTVYAEDLLAFQYSAAEVGRSLSAWQIYFAELGVRLNVTTTLGVWGDDIGARQQEPHSSVIYNYQEIVDVLREEGDPVLLGMLRE